MDDLIIYLIALFKADADLLAIYTAAGTSAVLAFSPEVRQEASYPRIIVWGSEGTVHEAGDTSSKMFEGQLKIDIYTRQSDADTDALSTMRLIKQRLLILLQGDPNGSQPEIRGTVVGDYRVSRFFQRMPTGRAPKQADPTVRKWSSTYTVWLNRLRFTEGT